VPLSRVPIALPGVGAEKQRRAAQEWHRPRRGIDICSNTDMGRNSEASLHKNGSWRGGSMALHSAKTKPVKGGGCARVAFCGAKLTRGGLSRKSMTK